jgi:cystathionine beta-lyase/cystathionine gamma-synthase
VRRQ